MLKRTVRLTASVAAMLAATTAIAEPTIEELDVRMRAMENNMQSILELLQAQQGIGTSPAAAPSNKTTEAPAAVPAGYQMGAIYLDVFTRKFADIEYNQMGSNPDKLPEGPQGVPSGSALIAAPADFKYGSFSEEASLAGFRKADALVGVQWFGTFFVNQRGDHTFALNLKREEQPGAATCRSVLRVSGKVVADVLARYNSSNEQVDTAQSTQTLDVGAYDFSLWTNCMRTREQGFDIISTTISLAAPGDRAPKPIPPEQFGVQQ